MKNRLTALKDQLSASYWFVPAVMAVLAVILSVTTIKLDEGIGHELRWVTGLVYVDSPEAARAVLSTVASSMITVAGVVFSLTMVVLSLTSQQYGPLILAHFMRDRGNQFVLGVFTATFIYCLLILRTIRGVESSVFVPHISVLLGLGLSIASLAVLIYFIHHVSQSIQAPNIIARLSDDLMDTINDMFPTSLGKALAHEEHEDAHRAFLERLEHEAYTIETVKSGYLQMIDDEALLNTARAHDLVVHFDVQPGSYLFKGQTLVRVLQMSKESDSVNHELQDAFIFGNQRTRTQDVAFVVTQLSALAVRALSPGINDPYTAIMVIDHLGEALSVMLSRQLPSMYRYDAESQLRVITATVNFRTVFHTAFDQIKHYGRGDLKVSVRLLEVFSVLWESTENTGNRNLLKQYAAYVYEESRNLLSSSENEELSYVYMQIKRTFQTQS